MYKVSQENIARTDLDKLFNAISEFFIIIDENNTILKVNPIFQAFLDEHNSADLVGKCLDEITSSDTLDDFLNIKSSAQELGSSKGEVCCNLSGFNIWFEISLTKLVQSNEYLGILHNVTERKRTGILLQESEERFRNMADNTPVMLWMADTKNNCYYFNNAWLDFTGRTIEEELGFKWQEHIHKDDLKRLLKAGIGKEQEAYTEKYRLKNKEGDYRWILEIGTPRYLSDGTYVGYMGSCVDVSDIQDIQEELHSQAIELKRSNKELENFAYVASHDLQEPLRMIHSYVQLIERKIAEKNDTELAELMSYATDGVKRMQGLINELLQYSRISRLGNPFDEVSSEDILNDAKHNLLKLIEENNAEIKYNDLPVLQADRSQLTRVFQNLIENAIKFKHPERDPVIEILCEELQDSWKFTVSDNGIGIEEKYFERIFIIFQRLHSRKHIAGTGLGLAICKKTIERHGGDISCTSNPNEGSQFYFTIKKELKNKQIEK